MANIIIAQIWDLGGSRGTAGSHKEITKPREAQQCLICLARKGLAWVQGLVKEEAETED